MAVFESMPSGEMVNMLRCDVRLQRLRAARPSVESAESSESGSSGSDSDGEDSDDESNSNAGSVNLNKADQGQHAAGKVNSPRQGDRVSSQGRVDNSPPWSNNQQCYRGTQAT